MASSTSVSYSEEAVPPLEFTLTGNFQPRPKNSLFIGIPLTNLNCRTAHENGIGRSALHYLISLACSRHVVDEHSCTPHCHHSTHVGHRAWHLKRTGMHIDARPPGRHAAYEHICASGSWREWSSVTCRVANSGCRRHIHHLSVDLNNSALDCHRAVALDRHISTGLDLYHLGLDCDLGLSGNLKLSF